MDLRADKQQVSDVLLYLTRAEVSELRDACEALLEHFDDPGWHTHVSSADFLIEITIAPMPGAAEAS